MKTILFALLLLTSLLNSAFAYVASTRDGVPFLLHANEKGHYISVCEPTIKEELLHPGVCLGAQPMSKKQFEDLVISLGNSNEESLNKFFAAVKSNKLEQTGCQGHYTQCWDEDFKLRTGSQLEDEIWNAFAKLSKEQSKLNKHTMISALLRKQSVSKKYFSVDVTGVFYALGVVNGEVIRKWDTDKYAYAGDFPFQYGKGLATNDKNKCQDPKIVNEYFKKNVIIYNYDGCESALGPNWRIPSPAELEAAYAAGFWKTPVGNIVKNHPIMARKLSFDRYENKFTGEDTQGCYPTLAHPSACANTLTGAYRDGVHFYTYTAEVPVCVCKAGKDCWK